MNSIYWSAIFISIGLSWSVAVYYLGFHFGRERGQIDEELRQLLKRTRV